MPLMKKMREFSMITFGDLLKRTNLYFIELMVCQIIVELHQMISVAEFVRKLKKSTHRFLDENKSLFPEFTAWSVGYCALTYSDRDKYQLINYIKNQKRHHKETHFNDEMKSLFQREGIDFNVEWFERNV